MTILLSVLFLAGNIFTFADGSGVEYKATLKGISLISEGVSTPQAHSTLPLIIFTLLTGLAAVITLFAFRNRKIQSKLAISVIILSVVLVLTFIYCIWFVISEYQAQLIPGYRMILPLLILSFAVLAYRGIKKDDNLVKSYDRLR
jgi:peptidoglycan/LPS O-acetylase OafA/YrhL